MTQHPTNGDTSPSRVDLRDTFAAAALTGLLSRSIAPEQAMSQYVRIAAAYADAMLHERARTNHDADGTGSTPSKAEIDALEYVVEEGRIASMDDYGVLRSWLIRLRPEWENQSYEESDEKRTNTTMSRDATPGEGSVQGEGTVGMADIAYGAAENLQGVGKTFDQWLRGDEKRTNTTMSRDAAGTGNTPNDASPEAGRPSVGDELVARIRHVADSLEAIAKCDTDSPQPFAAAYAVYLNGEYDSSYGPDAIDEALEIAADCNGEVVPLYRTPPTHATPGTVAPAAWLAVAADGSESSAVYLLKEQADAAAREWGWFVAPLYALPVLRAEDEIAIEAAWERTGLTPTWPADEAGCGVKYANAMADEIMRLRSPTLTDEERNAIAWAATVAEEWDIERAIQQSIRIRARFYGKKADTLRSLLERTK